MKMNFKPVIFGLLFALFTVSSASAATINSHSWKSEVDGVHTMQFWVNDAKIDIKSVKIEKKTPRGWSWKYTDDTKTSVLFTGPKADAKDIFTKFQFTAPNPRTKFEVEWAEISDTTTLTGILSYNDKNRKRWTSRYGDISHTPTPIPGAVFILGGGLSLLAFVRRRFS